MLTPRLPQTTAAADASASAEAVEFPSREVDYRRRPELYRVARGERGVFHCEPYKSELLPLWAFRTPEVATESAAHISAKFHAYLAAGDFPGADLARKYLQMGWTRARRYANHRGGRKYDRETGLELPREEDPVKAAAAAIFKAAYDAARADTTYQKLRADHIARHES